MSSICLPIASILFCICTSSLLCKNQSMSEHQMIRESLAYINTHSLSELFTIKSLTARYSECTISHHIDDEGIANIIFLANNSTISTALQQKCSNATSIEQACALTHITAITQSLSDYHLLEDQKIVLCNSIEKLYRILECTITSGFTNNPNPIIAPVPQKSKPFPPSFKTKDEVSSISYHKYVQTKYWLAGGVGIYCALFTLYKLYKKYNHKAMTQKKESTQTH